MFNKFIIILFFTFLTSLPLIGFLEDTAKKESFLYKKINTPLDNFSLTNDQTYLNLEKFLENKLGLNTLLIQARAKFLNALGMTGKPDLYLDKENRLYKLSLDHFSEDSINKIKYVFYNHTLEYLNAIQSYSNDNDISFHIVIAPDHTMIQEQNLPISYKNFHHSQQKKFQFVVDALKSSSLNVTTLDKAFNGLSKEELNSYFFKYDNHWNSRGSFRAYKYMIERITDKKIIDESELKISNKKMKDLNLARYYGLIGYLTENDSYYRIDNQGTKSDYTYFKDKYQLEIPKENLPFKITNENNEQKVLMYHDSMGQSFQAFIGRDFRHTVMVNPWKHEIQQQWKNCFLHPEILRHEKPDIFILQLVPSRLVANLLSCQEFYK